MIEGEAATVSTVLNPLLRALEMLAFVARHLHPPHLEELLDSIGKPDDALKTALAAHSPWPDSLSAIKQPIDEASETTLQAFTVLRRGIQVAPTFAAPYACCQGAGDALSAGWHSPDCEPLLSRSVAENGQRSSSAVPCDAGSREHRRHAVRCG